MPGPGPVVGDKKLRPLYLANSLAELNKQVEDSSKTKILNGINIKLLRNTADKLFDQASIAIIEQDEEKAYLYYMRFYEILKQISAISHKDSKAKEICLQFKPKFNQAAEMSETLCGSLKRRYDLQHHRVEEESKSNGVFKSIQKQDEKTLAPAAAPVKPNESGTTITPKELKTLLDKKAEKILMIDTRPRKSFKQCHILAPEVISIPAEVLKPGLTPGNITKFLDDSDAQYKWERRGTYDRIILYDEYSTKDALEMPIQVVFDAMTKWDVTIKYKLIQILDKGLSNFYHWYPFLLSDIYESKSKEESQRHLAESGRWSGVKLDHIHYPGVIEEEKKKPVDFGSISNGYGFDSNLNGTTVPGPLDMDVVNNMDPLLDGLNNVKLSTNPPVGPIRPPTSIKPTRLLPKPSTSTPTLPQPNSETSPSPRNNNPDPEPEQQAVGTTAKPIATTNTSAPASVTTLQPVAATPIPYTNNISLPLRPTAPKPINIPSSSVPMPERNGPVYGNGRPASQDVGGLSSSLSSSAYTKLRDDENRTNSILKRSHSNPNLAQMSQTFEENNSTIPAFNRSVKPSSIHDNNSPTYKPRREFQAIGSSDFRTRTGLKNLGNTCYMNSILQCLNHTAEFREYFLNHFESRKSIRKSHNLPTNGEITEEIAAAIKGMNAGHRSIQPTDLKNAIAIHNPAFKGNNQQDSHELLVILLDWLHEELNEVRKSPLKEQKNDGLPDDKAADIAWNDYISSNKSIISQLFCGQQKSSVCCTKCEKSSVTFDTFFNVTIPISSAQKCSLKECLDLYTRSETIDWNCPHCKCKREATKKIDLWRLPPYLIISFQRFFNDGYMRKKLTEVTFSEYLDLSSFLPFKNIHSDHLPSKKIHSDYLPSKTKKIHSDYTLYAVSNHYGSMEGGHYTADCRGNDSNWYKFDDLDVYAISVNQVCSSAAYILFYESKNPRIN